MLIINGDEMFLRYKLQFPKYIRNHAVDCGIEAGVLWEGTTADFALWTCLLLGRRVKQMR